MEDIEERKAEWLAGGPGGEERWEGEHSPATTARNGEGESRRTGGRQLRPGGFDFLNE